MKQTSLQRTPILAEVTNLALTDAEVWFNDCEGLKTIDGRTYAIIGWAYNEQEINPYW